MEINKSKFNPICPGLFQMKLKLMSTSNQARIENREITLHNAKKDHPIVHDVIDLMIIVLDNPLLKRRYLPYNIEKLELIMRRNPNHLNALADLAVLYRNSNLVDKAIPIEEKIDEILKGRDPNDIKEKAVCVLEQGYAELFEEYTEDGLEAQQKLLECLELIKVEKSTAVGRAKDSLCQASNNAMGARRLLFQALSCKTTDSFVDKKKSSVEILKTGLQYLATTSYPKEHVHIWEFYYAMACSRMPGIKAADFNKIPMCQKAVQLFWQVIVNLPKNNGCFTIYRARSYAYIGYILISTSDFNPKYSLLSNDEQFKDILKIPLLSFGHANDELPDDEVVLRREGMSLWILVKYGSTRNDEKIYEFLDRAEKVLSFSISISPCMHQVTFSTRMKVYFEMSSLQSLTLDRKKDVLKKALEDGKALIKNMMSVRDVCTVAEICQRLAKFPKFNLNGPEAVINNEKNVITADQFGAAGYSKSTTRHFEYDVNEASLLQRVRIEIEPADVQHNYRFDYCFIMSEVNSGWIQCFLQHQLTIQMVDGDSNFAGFPGIDYESSSSLLETTIDGINKSRTIILVLSKDLLTREWCMLKPIVTEMLQKRSDSLFIILLEQCDVPTDIDYKHLPYFDFTDEMYIPF
ncbi:unnamed protein product [Mytilus edulis]|uniref:TIR domain-containing protein n=1 Tax=Mytilus edulis TaxID=6550 RepID=A0A8S3PRS8_MYTED|nr:unnamed protein product [Mytilus edulis]